MSTIKELKEQAQELLNCGNSKEQAQGYGMMRVLNELETNYVEKWRSISWSVYDFEGRAETIWKSFADCHEVEGEFPYASATSWKDVFDKSKFHKALEQMINKHDCDTGINWVTVDFYLVEMCLIKK